MWLFGSKSGGVSCQALGVRLIEVTLKGQIGVPKESELGTYLQWRRFLAISGVICSPAAHIWRHRSASVMPKAAFAVQRFCEESSHACHVVGELEVTPSPFSS